MAKGQMRSNREAKKPRQSVAGKTKIQATSMSVQPTKINFKPHSKKG